MVEVPARALGVAIRVVRPLRRAAMWRRSRLEARWRGLGFLLLRPWVFCEGGGETFAWPTAELTSKCGSEEGGAAWSKEM